MSAIRTDPAPLDHFRQPLARTPFDAMARARCQTDSFVPWAGYSTIDVYTTVEHEYFAIRNAASVYDLTPMVKYRIAGPDAQAYLNRLVTRDVRKLKPGRVSYVVWCNDDGHLIDDGTLFCFSPTDYRLCTAERQLDWLADSAIGFEVEIEEVTSATAALALQGPTSCAVLKTLGLAGIDRLTPFAFASYAFDGISVQVSRTGFTGDLGYELWLAPTDAERAWERLLAAGHGVRPIGSRALNMARIEAGFLAPNVDFFNVEHAVRAGRGRSPLELGLDWLLDFDKGHFNGRRSLLRERAAPIARRLVGLDVAGNKPAHNALLYADERGTREIGYVTSALWSPTCKRNLALGFVDGPRTAIGSIVYADVYLNRELMWERRMVKARVVERPFYAPERRRLTPPADR